MVEGGIVRTLKFWFFATLVIGVCLANALFFYRAAAPQVREVLVNPGLTYDEKMSRIWGDYYAYMTFIQEHTPSSAVILIPPHGDTYPLVGCKGLDDYFLYPRRLINADQNALEEHPEVEYILIDGEFPDFPVAGERLMLNEQSGLIIMGVDK